MQLTYHTDYALRVLIYLVSRPAQKVTTRELAAFYGVSLHHLTKVVKALTKAGWVTATRGAGGGLLLARHTPAARLSDIIRQSENCELVECFNPATNTCVINGCCQLKPILLQARSAFFKVLDGYTVQDLARQNGPVNKLGSVRAASPSRRPPRKR